MSPHINGRVPVRPEQHGTKSMIWMIRGVLCVVALCMALASHQVYTRLSPLGKGAGTLASTSNSLHGQRIALFLATRELCAAELVILDPRNSQR